MKFLRKTLVFKCLILSLFLFLASLDGEAQINVDSIFQVAIKPLEKTIEAVENNNALCFSIYKSYPDLASKLATNSLSVSKEIDFQTGQARALSLFGNIYWVKGDYVQALNNHFQSRDIYLNANDSSGLATSSMNLSIVYDELFVANGDKSDDYKAKKYAFEALDFFRKAGNKEYEARQLNNLGTMYQYQKKYDSALNFFDSALEIKRLISIPSSTANTLNNIGLLYKNQKQYDRAQVYFSEALEIQTKEENFEGMLTIYLNIGQIFMEKEKFDMAMTNFSKGLELAKRIDAKKWISGIHGQMFAAEYYRGDLEKALEYQELYYTGRAEMIESQYGSKIENIEVNHNLKQKENELQLVSNELELTNEKRKNAVLFRNSLIIGLIIVVVFGFITVRALRQKMDRQQQYQIAKRALTDAELENAKLKEQELTQELEYKNKELTSYTVNFIQKNKILEDIKSITDDIQKKQDDPETIKQLGRLKQIVNQNLTQDKDWEDFKNLFENVHKDFFTNLKASYPELTTSDLKLCATLKLNMNLKETANIFGVEPASIKTARYRLKKKLKLNPEDDVLNFLAHMEKSSQTQGQS